MNGRINPSIDPSIGSISINPAAVVSFWKLLGFILSLLVLSNEALLLFGSTLSRFVARVFFVDQVNASPASNHLACLGPFFQASDRIDYLHAKNNGRFEGFFGCPGNVGEGRLDRRGESVNKWLVSGSCIEVSKRRPGNGRSCTELNRRGHAILSDGGEGGNGADEGRNDERLHGHVLKVYGILIMLIVCVILFPGAAFSLLMAVG